MERRRAVQTLIYSRPAQHRRPTGLNRFISLKIPSPCGGEPLDGANPEMRIPRSIWSVLFTLWNVASYPSSRTGLSPHPVFRRRTLDRIARNPIARKFRWKPLFRKPITVSTARVAIFSFSPVLLLTNFTKSFLSICYRLFCWHPLAEGF